MTFTMTVVKKQEQERPGHGGIAWHVHLEERGGRGPVSIAPVIVGCSAEQFAAIAIGDEMPVTFGWKGVAT